MAVMHAANWQEMERRMTRRMNIVMTAQTDMRGLRCYALSMMMLLLCWLEPLSDAVGEIGGMRDMYQNDDSSICM